MIDFHVMLSFYDIIVSFAMLGPMPLVGKDPLIYCMSKKGDLQPLLCEY